MSLSADLRRIEQHERFLAWDSESGKPQPEPGFKDCGNCRLVRFSVDESARRGICRSCPWDELPVGPSLAFRLAAKWADLPDVVLGLYANEMELSALQNIGEVLRYRQARMMGASILGH